MLTDDPESLFKGWLAEHGAVVGRVARAYTRTAEERQDLAQEILLQVWQSLPRFEGRADPATWSYRVALNTALGWHRKERRRRTRQQPIQAVEDRPVAGPDGPKLAAERELVDHLYAAIGRLPGADAALILLYLDDLSYRQIAEVLGISENHVGVKLTRARKALGTLMKEAPHGP